MPRLVLPASAYVVGAPLSLPVSRRGDVGEGRGSVGAPGASTNGSGSNAGAGGCNRPFGGGSDPKRGSPCVRKAPSRATPANLDEKAAFWMHASERQGSLRGLHRPDGAASRRLECVRVFWECGPPKQPRLQLSPVPCPLARCPASGPRGNTAHRGESVRLPPVASCACSALTVAQSQGRPPPTTGGVTGRAGSTVWRR